MELYRVVEVIVHGRYTHTTKEHSGCMGKQDAQKRKVGSRVEITVSVSNVTNIMPSPDHLHANHPTNVSESSSHPIHKRSPL